MKMERIESSETSALKAQTPGDYPKKHNTASGRYNFHVKICTRFRMEGLRKTWKILRINLVWDRILNLDFGIRNGSADNYTATFFPYYVIRYTLRTACQYYCKRNTGQNLVMLVWYKEVTLPVSHHCIIYINIFIVPSYFHVFSYTYFCFLNKLRSSKRHS